MTLLYILLSFIIGILLSIYIYLKSQLSHWSNRGIYQLPTTLIFGNALDIIRGKQTVANFINDAYKTIKSERKSVGGVYFMKKPYLIVTDLNHIEHILSKDFESFSDRTIIDNGNPLRKNLFTLPYSEWKSMRNKLCPIYSKEKLQVQYFLIEQYGNNLVQTVKDNKIFNATELSWKYTAAVFSTGILGIEGNNFVDSKNIINKIGADIFQQKTFNQMKRQYSYLIRRSSLTSNTQINSIFKDVVGKIIDERTKNNNKKKDVLQILIDSGLSSNEIAAQCYSFFVLGCDTIANMLQFCLYEFCMSQAFQNEIREEVNGVFKKHNGKFSFESLMEMTVLEAFIKETLRKYPLIPFLTRECTKDYTLPKSDIKLKKGDAIIIPSYGVQLDQKNAEMPQRVDPARFLEGRFIKQITNPFIFLPFGEGPRNCIGKEFALLQGKLALAHLVKDFVFTVADKTRLPFDFAKDTFVLSIDRMLWLNAKPVDT